MITALWARIAGLIAIVCLIFALGLSIGASRKQHQWDSANAKAYQKSIAETAVLAREQAEIKEDAENAQKADELRVAGIIDSLRKRADSLPRTAAAPGKTVTAARCVGPSGEFFVREAAESLKWQRQLVACYAREDILRAAMIGNRK